MHLYISLYTLNTAHYTTNVYTTCCTFISSNCTQSKLSVLGLKMVVEKFTLIYIKLHLAMVKLVSCPFFTKIIILYSGRYCQYAFHKTLLLAGFFWYRCYYPNWLRDYLSPVCGIFIKSFDVVKTVQIQILSAGFRVLCGCQMVSPTLQVWDKFWKVLYWKFCIYSLHHKFST